MAGLFVSQESKYIELGGWENPPSTAPAPSRYPAALADMPTHRDQYKQREWGRSYGWMCMHVANRMRKLIMYRQKGWEKRKEGENK